MKSMIKCIKENIFYFLFRMYRQFRLNFTPQIHKTSSQLQNKLTKPIHYIAYNSQKQQHEQLHFINSHRAMEQKIYLEYMPFINMMEFQLVGGFVVPVMSKLQQLGSVHPKRKLQF